jgi:hypothetical protein
MQRESIMFALEGVDGQRPRFVARNELIQIFAGMAQSDLVTVHGDLLTRLANPIDYEHFIKAPVKDLLELLELHTRAVNALQALMATRHPDELVEAFA